MLDMEIEDLTTDCKELQLLELNFPICVLFCTKAWNFPFLIKRVEMDKNSLVEGAYERFRRGYALPRRTSKVVAINGSRRHGYMVRFNTLWTNVENPIVDYMSLDLEMVGGEFTAPDDFLSLVAYQLALHVAPMLSPESTSTSVAAQMYALTLQNMKESEWDNNDRDTNFGADDNLRPISVYEYRQNIGRSPLEE